jgi:hypothetical protein
MANLWDFTSVWFYKMTLFHTGKNFSSILSERWKYIIPEDTEYRAYRIQENRRLPSYF